MCIRDRNAIFLNLKHLIVVTSVSVDLRILRVSGSDVIIAYGMLLYTLVAKLHQIMHRSQINCTR